MRHGWHHRVCLLLIAVLTCGAAPAKKAVTPTAPPAKTFDAPLAKSPLTPPLIVTGGFGEYRQGHFHAGFDFGTGKKVGQPVFAPLAGHVERIRASGVGYGRSIYLRTRDGRLLQFGHLDAYAEPMASYVRAIQDSSGVYEQDLWPEASRFPIKLGQRIAWTGESGAGGPHMHFEIRRGDMAYHPQLAGLTVKDERAPSIASITLEPLDDTSYVERSAAPVTRNLGARPETLRVIGRVRAVVGARDGTWSGVDRMVPWVTRMDWAGQWIECRMDSISWATDMSEGDYVYDAGRVVGDKGIVLWASRGFRPRFIRSSTPLAEEAGTIQVRRGDAPLTVRFEARDVAGHVARRTVVIRPGLGPDTTQAYVVKNPRKGDDRFEYTALPYGMLRLTYRGTGLELRSVRFGRRLATPGAGGWVVVGQVSASVRGRKSDGGEFRDTQDNFMWNGMKEERYEGDRSYPVDWQLPQDARFDSSAYLVEAAGFMAFRRLPPEAPFELSAAKGLLHFGPESEPLRGRLKLMLPASAESHTGLFRLDPDGWTWVAGNDGSGKYETTSSRLGWFAEFQDTLGPRITLRAPPRAAIAGPYNRWAVEVGIVEKGSGMNARASYFVVDGKKVAAEWDPEADVLRWRPLKRPAPGTHKYDVIAEDRAGNASIRSGTFVLD